MRSRLTYILLVIFLLSLACSLPLLPGSAVPLPQVDPLILVTEDPNASPTPTPFQPERVTVTPTAIKTTSNPTQVIITPAPTEIPPTVKPLPQPTNTLTPLTLPEGQVNILLLGSDLRSRDPAFRTDIILWVSINPHIKSVSVISFPRDLYVFLPGVGMQRINTAQEFGGFALTQATFETNFGVRPDHYMLTNFSGFTSIIDILGGIDVNTAENLTDSCDIPGYNEKCSVGPGLVRMDSRLALWYVRSRYTTDDIDRGRRAQEVALAIFYRLLSLDALSQAPKLYEQFQGMIETDLSLVDILPLLPVAASLGDGSAIRRYTVGWGQVYSSITPDGAMVLVPIPGAIQAVFSEALSQ
jgi:LCP family protein required for cell wall assembly